MYHRMQRGKVAKADLLGSVGPEYDINGMEQGVEIVLILSGIELIFFIIPRMVQCFEFLVKTSIDKTLMFIVSGVTWGSHTVAEEEE